MDEFFDIPTLIVIGVAIVVLFRLRPVLGTRTGNERSPLQRAQQQAQKPANSDEKVVPMRPAPSRPATDGDAERRAIKLDAEIEQLSHGNAEIAAGLKAIAEADPTFSPKIFLEGAKQAYEMIVTAFATGDRKTLKNLLEKDVYDGFERAITDREAAGQQGRLHLCRPAQDRDFRGRARQARRPRRRCGSMPKSSRRPATRTAR